MARDPRSVGCHVPDVAWKYFASRELCSVRHTMALNAAGGDRHTPMLREAATPSYRYAAESAD
jgi:hypothetical protein